MNPHEALRRHVTGAIERGEAEPIVAVEPVKHEITIDEDTDPDGKKFRASCTDECGWKGGWQHEDRFDDIHGVTPDLVAMEAAELEGQQHLVDVGAVTD